MIDVTGIGTTATAATGGTPVRESGLGAVDGEAFLRLLVTQLRTQDPTEPMSATDQMAQLATFAQVEQSVAIRDAAEVSALGTLMEGAAALVGRHVSAPDGQGGTVSAVRLEAGGALAILEDGTTLPLTHGLTVGEGPGA